MNPEWIPHSCESIEITDAIKELRGLKWELPKVVNKSSDCYEVVHDWDEDVWTVYHMNQIHYQAGMHEKYFEVVLESQILVFQQLNRISPNVIVSETFNESSFQLLLRNTTQKWFSGRIGDLRKFLPPQDSLEDVLIGLRNTDEVTSFLKRIFPDGVTTDFWELNEAQKNVFVWFGADLLFSLLSGAPLINDSREPELRKDMFTPEGKKNLAYLHKEREWRTQDTVKRYLNTTGNEGDTVTIVYWGYHNFSNEFACEDWCPVFKEINFPSLDAKLPIGYSWNPYFWFDFEWDDPGWKIDSAEASRLWN